ncbi:radical SAM protein, partial [candidate division WOR-3 bacterium]|nr:radical SAM protein [candidate division WOR-3 bacterium]
NYFPDTKIVLGGIYATLLPEHARELENIDYVITGNNFNSIVDSIFEILNIRRGTFPGINILDDLPFIDYSLYKSLDSITTVNSLGCPFGCPYCASSILYKKFQYKSSKYINKEFKRYMTYNVSDIAFYDDAFLMHPEIIKILKILKLFPFKYHLPNGVHAKFITPRIAKLLFDAGFKTIRIGYEVYDNLLQDKMGGKVTNKILKNAIDHLNNAGYFSGEIGVYVLGGHPKIPINTLENSIKYLSDMGVRIYISEYSPVPKTPDGELYYKKGSDPLFTNNSLRRFINDKDRERYFDLKCFIRTHNSEVAGN